MILKYAYLLLSLLVIIGLAYLVQGDDTSDGIGSAIDLVEVDSLAEPGSILVVGSMSEEVIANNINIDPGASTDLPESVFVQGGVNDQLGQGIRDMQIEISHKDSLTGNQKIYTATTDHRGEFLFDAIPPGNNYRLEVLSSGTYLGILVDSFAISIDMPLVMLTLDSIELVTVDGMIVDVDNAPVANFEMLVQNVGIAYPGRRIISDSSGFFHLAGFPGGELQISTRGAEHFKISGISLNSNMYRNLTLVLDKGGYHLSGWVSDEFDAPITQARVTLTSILNREDYQSSSYRSRVTDSNGVFAFAELGGQEHLLSIDAIGYETRQINYRFQSFSDDLEIKLQRK